MREEAKGTPVNSNAASQASLARAMKLADVIPDGSSASTPHQATAEMPVANASSVKPEEMLNLVKSTNKVESTDGQITNSEANESKLVEPEVKEDPLSTQYAILARKEKALRAKAAQQEQLLKSERAAFEAEKAQLLGKAQQVDQSKFISRDSLKNDLIGTLAEVGVSYDDITNMMLDQPKKDPYVSAEMNRLQETIRKLEERLDGTVKNQTEQQEQAYKGAIAQIQRDAEELVSSDPSYETIRETGQSGEIVKLIEATFKEEGYVMSVEEAAQAIEEELIERILATAKIKKIQDKLKPVAPVEKPQDVKAQSQPIKTLTNSMGSTRKLSAVERAHLAFAGKLEK